MLKDSRRTRVVTPGAPLSAAMGFAAIAFLLAAAPASAALTYAEGSNTSTAGGNQGTATVECPGVSYMVGGGAFSSGAFAAVAIASSTPAGNTIWSEDTDVYSGTQLHRAYVVCDTTEPTIEFNNANVPANHSRTVRAGCPSSENVYGGGYNSGGGYGDSNTRSSRPFDDGDDDRDRDDGWEATFFNFALAPTAVTVYAECGPKKSTVESATRDISPNSQRRVAKSCPAGDHVSGGGAEISGDGKKTWISSTYPADTGDPDDTPDDRWSAYLENTTGKRLEITAYSVCR